MRPIVILSRAIPHVRWEPELIQVRNGFSQGNYLGVAADGLTPIANSTVGGSGILSIDHIPGVIVGGPEPTAINIFGESLGHGIAPLEADNLVIENNYIGLGYDGTTILGNGSSGSGSGIALSDSENVNIRNNRVAGWSAGGISVNSDNIGVAVLDNVVFANGEGISVYGTDSVQIGAPNNGNTVYDNSRININAMSVSPFGLTSATSLKIQANTVGLDEAGIVQTSQAFGILVNGDTDPLLIGGTSPGEGNIIAGNSSAGIAVSTFSLPAASVTLSPSKATILGNSIYSNSQYMFPSSGLGIDLFTQIDASDPPDGIPDTFTDIGPTPNDSTDSDTGPNNYINFPELNSVVQDGTNATINFNLDAADSPTNQYRVEFFSNDAVDPSGYGEGQTYLGFANVSNGNSQQAVLSLPNNINLTGKSISATTTAIDTSTASDFGATSEFSAIIAATTSDLSVDPITGSNTGLASTGSSQYAILIASIGLLVTSLTSSVVYKKHKF